MLFRFRLTKAVGGHDMQEAKKPLRHGLTDNYFKLFWRQGLI